MSEDLVSLLLFTHGILKAEFHFFLFTGVKYDSPEVLQYVEENLP